MTHHYAILGSGRQGTAAAYDLAVHGDAASILLADLHLEQAEAAAARVNRLAGRNVATAAALNVRDEDAVVELLRAHHVEAFISGVPYFFNLALARAAVRAGASMADFGGNTDQTRAQLALDADARAAGITLTPDCGQVPGLGNSLCAYTMSLFDACRDLIMYDGGIPAAPQPPWHYILTFNIEGLTNEYFGTTAFIRNGQLIEMGCFQPEEYELVDFGEGIGTLEAFTTAGGTSTMPWTWEGKLRTLQNKTIRWPGHFAQWKAFSDAGLIDLEPVAVDGQMVVPRHVLHALLGPRLYARPDERDLVIVRIIGRGLKNGVEREVVVDLFDRYDEATGFTAMERTTGWHAAIICAAQADGRAPRGGVPVELALSGPAFAAELAKRGFDLRVTWQEIAGQ
jgi:lysine 6-dehydrogenase